MLQLPILICLHIWVAQICNPWVFSVQQRIEPTYEMTSTSLVFPIFNMELCKMPSYWQRTLTSWTRLQLPPWPQQIIVQGGHSHPSAAGSYSSLPHPYPSIETLLTINLGLRLASGWRLYLEAHPLASCRWLACYLPRPSLFCKSAFSALTVSRSLAICWLAWRAHPSQIWHYFSNHRLCSVGPIVVLHPYCYGYSWLASPMLWPVPFVHRLAGSSSYSASRQSHD